MNLQLPSLLSSGAPLPPRPASPDSDEGVSRGDMKYAALSGYTENVTGSERVFVSPKRRPLSPKRSKRRSNISVNKRPYSASESSSLDKSPYRASVAPHIHNVKSRPASAKKLMHFV